METKSLPREAVLIVNARSRKGEAMFEETRDKLVAAGVSLIAAHGVKDPEQMAATVARAVKDGAPMVIVGGGDGSLSGTVDELVGSNCVFAVLPLGTANSFARTLGVPLDIDQAIATIATGQRRRIDLGMINDDYFVNAASMGLSPMIGETVPHNLKKYLGRVGYLAWAVKCFFGLRPFRLSIDDGKGEKRMWATEVRILNGRFHGGVELSEEADVQSGDIMIQAVTGRSLTRLSADWYAKFFKLRSRDAHTQDFTAKRFRLDTRPHLPISIDGEVLARTPCTVRVAAGAIEVAVPAEPAT
jgi:YegS/Rv2252/BmrU family lipid kinase